MLDIRIWIKEEEIKGIQLESINWFDERTVYSIKGVLPNLPDIYNLKGQEWGTYIKIGRDLREYKTIQVRGSYSAGNSFIKYDIWAENKHLRGTGIIPAQLLLDFPKSELLPELPKKATLTERIRNML